MSAKGAGSKAGAAMDDMRADIASTRTELGDTVDTLADKTRTKARPGLWATVGTGLVAAAAAVGVMRWRRQRRTPQSRAKRMWHKVTDRFS
jgi:Protein of unknown function (DUF3618)